MTEVVSYQPPYRPATDGERALVAVLVFNDTPDERIAAILRRTLDDLQYTFARELNFAKDEILAKAAACIIEAAGQKEELGIALRANELILKTHSKAWREPRSEPEPQQKRISDMTLADVEAEIARIQRRRATTGSL
jgi:cell pole-organizing protein PopZ